MSAHFRSEKKVFLCIKHKKSLKAASGFWCANDMSGTFQFHSCIWFGQILWQIHTILILLKSFCICIRQICQNFPSFASISACIIQSIAKKFLSPSIYIDEFQLRLQSLRQAYVDCYLVDILCLSAFGGARIGSCDIKPTDGATFFSYLRTRETSEIDQ